MPFIQVVAWFLKFHILDRAILCDQNLRIAISDSVLLPFEGIGWTITFAIFSNAIILTHISGNVLKVAL